MNITDDLKYTKSYGTYIKDATIDDNGGERFSLIHPDMARALRARFDGGSACVWSPTEPGVILQDVENFWDGCRRLMHIGGGVMRYDNPYTGVVEDISPTSTDD